MLESATEQSRRSWTPQLDDCVTSKQVVATCKRACVHGDMVIVLHQDATKTWEQLETGIAKLSDTCLKDGRPRTIYVLVGPEGGISDAEVEAFTKAGAEVCVLGSNIHVRPPPVRSRCHCSREHWDVSSESRLHCVKLPESPRFLLV